MFLCHELGVGPIFLGKQMLTIPTNDRDSSIRSFFLEPKRDKLFKHSKLKLRIMMRRTLYHLKLFFLERSFILLVRLFTEKKGNFSVYRKRVFLTIDVNFVQKHTHANKPKKMLKETY